MLITSKQESELSIKQIERFSHRMMISLTANLGETFKSNKEEVFEVIKSVVRRYNIIEEQNLENYLLLHYSHLQIMQLNDPELKMMLSDQLKSEEKKIRELHSYLLTTGKN